MVRNITNAMRCDEEAPNKASDNGLNIYELTPEQRVEYRAGGPPR